MNFDPETGFLGDDFDMIFDKGLQLLDHQHLRDRGQELLDQLFRQGMGRADFQQRDLIFQSQPDQGLFSIAVRDAAGDDAQPGTFHQLQVVVRQAVRRCFEAIETFDHQRSIAPSAGRQTGKAGVLFEDSPIGKSLLISLLNKGESLQFRQLDIAPGSELIRVTERSMKI